MARLQEVALRRLIQGGETTTVEFKIAVPRPVEIAGRGRITACFTDFN